MGSFRLIGIMSGTSLDGIDVACCTFEKKSTKWCFEIENACTIPYSSSFKNRLEQLDNSTAADFAQTHVDLGILIGNEINQFIEKNNIHDIDAIASHGHTIFHQPKKSLTVQIGSGAHIASITGIPTICDFRTKDVALNGQGAPLVPIGDELLFNEYDYCLNLGGIANISFKDGNQRRSFDLGFANMASNYLTQQLGKEYDDQGEIARSGTVDLNLLHHLANLEYFSLPYPKSLGKEDFINEFVPVLNNCKLSVQKQLCTFSEHLTTLISDFLNQRSSGRVLVTGGGALNNYWIERLQKRTNCEIIVPNDNLTHFKEALIFAFLGLLRIEQKNNTLASVTGAKYDSIGGCIYL